jgi:hypothetical protein
MTRLNLLRPHNTDGIINGLVTVFAFAPAPMTNLKWPLHPDTRICTQLKSCTMTIFWLRDKLHRDTAPAPIYQLSATETDFQPLSNLAPRPRHHAIKFVP